MIPTIQLLWNKFNSIIYEYRKSEFNSEAFMNFEYLVNALNKVQKQIDVSKADRIQEEDEHEKMRSRAYSWWPQQAY